MSLNKRIFTGGPAPIEDAFTTKLYTGDGQPNNQVTGFGFAPDLIWLKDRDTGYPHYLYDTTRGTKKGLRPSETEVQSTDIGVSHFISDGFKLDGNAGANQNNSPNIAWAWKCNGGNTSTNTDGNRNSTVQVNNDTGLSIINYTGADGGIGGSGTVGHGLTGIPRLIIGKSTNWANNWIVYLHDGTDYYHGYLDGTDALTKNSSNTQVGTSSTLPTSSVINVSHVGTDNGTYDYMLWCWEPKAGYSSFGSYTSNASTKITIGFEPEFMIFRYVGGGDWYMQDLTRWAGSTGANGGKLIKKYLEANEVDAEKTVSTGGVEVMSDGFYPTNWFDTTNGTVYMAWRNAP